MFRFEDPKYLYLLVLIPVLALIHILMVHRQKRRIMKFGEPELVRKLMPNVSKWRPIIKFWLLEAALSLMIVMLARPQFGTKIRNEKRIGIETIIALDISNSMLAEDVEPSRLERSKMMVENLVDNFTDDKIGLIVFAGDAFVQLPITSDYVSAKMFLSSINPSMISVQGTDIATAINMAANSFTQQEGVGKAIIVITDGENHERGAVEAAESAKKKGMNVFVLGVGSTKGAPVPVQGSNDYIKDNMGNTVVSALNETMCREIASAGGGVYIHVANNSNAQKMLDTEIEKLSKKEISTNIYSDYDEQFQAVGILVLLLLIAEICILECKNPLLRKISLFGAKRKTIMLIIVIMSAFSVSAQTDRQYVRSGNKQFRSGKYEESDVLYRKSLEKNSRNPQAVYNLGNALLAQGKDSAAIVQFESAAKLETNPLRKAQSYHNMGYICQSKRLYAEAIDAYKEALRLNPNDDMTRYNLAVCKREKQKQDQQNKQNQQNQDKDNKDNNKDNKDNKQDDKKEQEKDKQNQQQQNKQDQQDNKDKMSKENAEQLLNAAMQQEKNTQERMKKAIQQAGKRRLEKNW